MRFPAHYRDFPIYPRILAVICNLSKKDEDEKVKEQNVPNEAQEEGARHYKTFKDLSIEHFPLKGKGSGVSLYIGKSICIVLLHHLHRKARRADSKVAFHVQ